MKTGMLVYLVAGLIENRQEVNRMASGAQGVQSQGAELGAEPGCSNKGW
jgi:hypothetical protein